MPKINFQWLIPVATAVWAVVTWTLDRQRQRNDERARIAALYVNPFVAACEDLQHRIYIIMEEGGLPTLHKRYPDGSYADEVLYLIARFFGWGVAVERHGPYTQDPVLMRRLSGVRKAFATSSSPQEVGPFNFFNAEQYALGKLVMTTTVDEYGVEPDTMSYYEFRKRLALPPLSDSKSVQETLEALRSADDVGSLRGGHRLAEAQSHLAELLDYLERKEGYTLSAGERKKCRTPKRLRTTAGKKPLSA